MRNREYHIQVAVVLWLKANYPDALFTASAGGARTSISQGKKLKLIGYTRGTPDLAIFEPRGGLHGLFIELKDIGGRPDKEGNQEAFIKKLKERGYLAKFCYGYDEATRAIDDYLSNKI